LLLLFEEFLARIKKVQVLIILDCWRLYVIDLDQAMYM